MAVEITTANDETLAGIREALKVPGLNEDGAIEATVLVRQGTAAALNEIVLGDGEIAIVLVEGSPAGIRVGDGVTSGGVQINLSKVVGFLDFFDAVNEDFVSSLELADGSLISQTSMFINGDLTANLVRPFGLAPLIKQFIVATNQNNFDTESRSLIHLSPTSNLEITGFLVGEATATVVYLLNTSSTHSVTLKNQSGSSNANNRIASTTGSDIVISPGRVAQMIYANLRWRAWLC